VASRSAAGSPAIGGRMSGEALERATREIAAHRARAIEILERDAPIGAFFVNPRAVEHDLKEARQELGAALTLLGSTDWPAPGTREVA